MSNQISGTVQFIKSMLGIFFDSDGKLNSSKLILGTIIIVCTLIYYHRIEINQAIQDFNYSRSYDGFIETVKAEKLNNYNASVKNQARVVYSNMRSDSVGVFIYDPEDSHHFENLIHYEGVLPYGKTFKDYLNQGVDKTSTEYVNHINGIPYHTNWETKEFNTAESYNYSCPIFNSMNVYIGYIGLYWNKTPILLIDDPESFNTKIFTACTSASRQIGVYK